MSDRRGPNFFVIGFHKCGTTSMHAYLRQHPEIFMPWIKELHHFATDLHVPRFFKDQAEYLDLYKGSELKKAAGDVSPSYVYSHTAPQAIRDFCPEAKIVVMLRNPVDMLYSLHSSRLWTEKEVIQDFRQAMDPARNLQEQERLLRKRADGDVMPYRETVRYAHHIARWQQVFGRDRVKVLILEELNAKPQETFSDLCRYLGVSPSFTPDFSVKNPNKSLKRGVIARTIRAIPPRWRYRAELYVPEDLRLRIIRKVVGSFTEYQPRGALDGPTRQQLAKEFDGEIRQVEQLLGREVQAWRRKNEVTA